LVLPGWNLLSQIPAPTIASTALYGGWFLLQAGLQVFAPGEIHEGVPLADGSRLKYKMNGWFSFWFTMILAVAVVVLGWIPATVFYDHFGPLLTTVHIFAFVFSFFLFFLGKTSKFKEHLSHNAFYDYFMGTALNPRVGSFDLKL